MNIPCMEELHLQPLHHRMCTVNYFLLSYGQPIVLWVAFAIDHSIDCPYNVSGSW